MDSLTLPRHAYHHLMYTLRKNLPPAPQDPAAALARDYAAIAQVSSLCPANAAEAAIAAQAVAANAQAMETMGLANDPGTDRKQALQCVAQVASMMRQAQGALRVLHAMQAERRKREADDASAHGSAWLEYGAAQWMQEALAVRPGPAPAVSGDDPMDHAIGHGPDRRAHETAASEQLDPFSGVAELSQNQGRFLAPQSDETKSDGPCDRTPCAWDTGSSQESGHSLTPYRRETKSGAPFGSIGGAADRRGTPECVLSPQNDQTEPREHRNPFPGAGGTDLSQNPEHILTLHGHETESAGASGGTRVESSQNQMHTLTPQSHETNSALPGSPGSPTTPTRGSVADPPKCHNPRDP